VISRDRELLARAARVNARLGEITLALFEHQDGGELPADGIRELGRHLAQLGVELLARAAELDGRGADRIILDAHHDNPISATGPATAR
jgi:hypothetical protein